jgi:hypothetical protein
LYLFSFFFLLHLNRFVKFFPSKTLEKEQQVSFYVCSSQVCSIRVAMMKKKKRKR